MSNLHTDSTFQNAIGQSPRFANEAAERLSVEDRLVLLEILQQRIQQAKRQDLIAEVAAVREEYRSGNVRFGSVSDFMAELDEEIGKSGEIQDLVEHSNV